MEKVVDVLENNEFKSKLLSLGINAMTGVIAFEVMQQTHSKYAISLVPMVGIAHCLKKKVEDYYHHNQFLLKQSDIRELRFLYNDYLSRVVDIFLNYEITNPLEVADYFERALWNGAFSQEGSFQYDAADYKHNLEILTGKRIMSGVGCCRHISALFDEFLDYYPFKNSFVLCGKRKNDKVPIHAVNLLEVNGKKMIRDITCKKSYLFVTRNQLKSVDGKSCIFLTPGQDTETNQLLKNLPPLTLEEYQHAKAMRSILPKERMFDQDMKKLNQQSKKQLIRICQIEEGYSVPELKKAKVFQK